MWETAFKNSNFLKAVFCKFYLVHSWILCPIWKCLAPKVEAYEHLSSINHGVFSAKIVNSCYQLSCNLYLTSCSFSYYLDLLIQYILNFQTWCHQNLNILNIIDTTFIVSGKRRKTLPRQTEGLHALQKNILRWHNEVLHEKVEFTNYYYHSITRLEQNKEMSALTCL